jgi:hypothetical protein
MLTFFRRIRKGLFDGGRTDDPPRRMSASTSKPASPIGRPASPAGRYLLYAIGEILLVMIGILLALQVNNWNEWRKARDFELKMLTEISLSLSRDTAYFRMLTGRLTRIDTSTEHNPNGFTVRRFWQVVLVCLWEFPVCERKPISPG